MVTHSEFLVCNPSLKLTKKKKRGGGGSEIRTDPHWVCGESAQLLFFHLHSLQM